MHREGKLNANPHNFDTLIQAFELTTGGLLQLLLPEEIEMSEQSESPQPPPILSNVDDSL